jgi:hypothetical protein
MECRIDLGAKPVPLTVRLGDGGFTIFHDYLDASERAGVMEALDSPMLGVAAAMNMLWKKFTAWEGVKDKSGNPVAMKSVSHDGKETLHIAAVLGRVSWVEQLRLMAAQLALNGVALANFRKAIMNYARDESELATVLKDYEDFLSKLDAAGNVLSPSSSGTAVAPASSV